jgi:TatD DNase family protein
MYPYFDTHAHLAMLASRGIPAETRIPELFGLGFDGIIDVGTEAGDLAGRIRGFGHLEKVRFSAGIWPSPEAITAREEGIRRLERELEAAPPRLVVAIGECGLDRHHNTRESGRAGGEEGELLEMQLDLARRRGLPVIIHSREAAAETAAVLAKYPGLPGVIHCFSYGKAEATRFLDLGYHISFAGNLTYKNAHPLREALPRIPPDRLLLETDAPYLAPMPHRGQSAEPGMVAETYALAAELRNTTQEDLIRQIRKNILNLFGV